MHGIKAKVAFYMGSGGGGAVWKKQNAFSLLQLYPNREQALFKVCKQSMKWVDQPGIHQYHAPLPV